MGDLRRYRITAAIDELSVDVTLTGQVPPWRPGTGYVWFGADQSRQFCWLPSVPQGTVEARYRIGDEARQTTGIGYHDHNWGNAALPTLIHDWYWARGQAGPYSVITAYVTAHVLPRRHARRGVRGQGDLGAHVFRARAMSTGGNPRLTPRVRRRPCCGCAQSESPRSPWPRSG